MLWKLELSLRPREIGMVYGIWCAAALLLVPFPCDAHGSSRLFLAWEFPSGPYRRASHPLRSSRTKNDRELLAEAIA